MLIDTHCHLDAVEFDADRDAVIADSQRAGVSIMVLPAVGPANFDQVRCLAHAHEGLVYALGVHPMLSNALPADWEAQLQRALLTHRDDPRLVAVGEIGLDGFVAGLDPARQEQVFQTQLRLAASFDLPVLLHVRKAQDRVLKYLRAVPVRGGIAHAFNGSHQQAAQFIERGFALGFGGAMTFTRALQIRRLASELPDHAHVLETDAPDIAPEWIARARNDPTHLPRIVQELARLRDEDPTATVLRTTANARRVLPALDAWVAAGGHQRG